MVNYKLNRQAPEVQEQNLRKKFSAHRFILSPEGIMKIIVIILFLVGPILSLSAGVCYRNSQWLHLTFPIFTVTSGVIVAALYISSALGLAKKFPNIWAKVDIGCCTVLAVITLVLSIMVISNCSSDRLSTTTGVLGIIGCLFLIVSAAAVFVTWLNSEDIVVPEEPTRRPEPSRKSVMI